jgi:hypothetical protein
MPSNSFDKSHVFHSRSSDMSTSYYFDQIGNQAPSNTGKNILLDEIRKNEKTLESLRIELRDSEPKWKAANYAFDATQRLLDDAILRLHVVSTLKRNTSGALDKLEDICLGDADQARLEDGPATGATHISVATKLLSQQESPRKILRDRITVLEDEEQKALAAVAKERGEHDAIQVQLFSLDESRKLHKVQESGLKSSIQLKRLILSSRRRLSEDIWLEIFHFMVSSPLQLGSVDQSSLVVVNPALALCHVCQAWRRVVQAQATVWRYLYINTLAFNEPSRRYFRFCLSKIGGEVSLLHVQIRDGTEPQARVLTNQLKGLKIGEICICATTDSTEVVTYLLKHLPTPVTLRVRNEDTKELQSNPWIANLRPRTPARLLNITLDNCFLTRSFAPNLTINFTWPQPMTVFLGRNFINVTTVILTGFNSSKSKRSSAVKFIFPHLRYIAGPLEGLVNTFDASCEMPGLSRLGVWIENGVQPTISSWRQFLAQSNPIKNLKIIEIHDMDPIAASSILKYLLELDGLPQLTLLGRSVDVISQDLTLPNPELHPITVESVLVDSYAGDGSSVYNLVKSRNSDLSSPIPEITNVIWVGCDNVTLHMRREVDRLVKR